MESPPKTAPMWCILGGNTGQQAHRLLQDKKEPLANESVANSVPAFTVFRAKLLYTALTPPDVFSNGTNTYLKTGQLQQSAHTAGSWAFLPEYPSQIASVVCYTVLGHCALQVKHQLNHRSVISSVQQALQTLQFDLQSLSGNKFYGTEIFDLS